jgi:hypothetical protein
LGGISARRCRLMTKPPPELPTKTTGIIAGWWYENGKPICPVKS